jgi:L-lactate dehydrogenase complex protein LldF
MKAMAAAFGSRRRYEAAQRLAGLGRGPLAKAALPGWSAMRDLPEPPKETFRDWRKRRGERPAAPASGAAAPPPTGAPAPPPTDAPGGSA